MKHYIIIFVTIHLYAAIPDPITIETRNLMLRAATEDDAEELASIALDPLVLEKTGLFPPMSTIDEVRSYISQFLCTKRYPISWIVVHKNDNRIIGLVTFVAYVERHGRAELGYAFASAYWGRGYATEASQAAIEFIRQHTIHRIYATIDPENYASERVAQKLGMSYEGLLRSYMIIRGERKDRKMYALVLDEK